MEKKNDNRIAWVFAIATIFTMGVWIVSNHHVIKKESAGLVDNTIDTLDKADSIDQAFYSDSSVLNDGEIPKPKAVKPKPVFHALVDIGTVKIIITHHWNIPDCNSAMDNSPCKVDMGWCYVEYNDHKK